MSIRKIVKTPSDSISMVLGRDVLTWRPIRSAPRGGDAVVLFFQRPVRRSMIQVGHWWKGNDNNPACWIAAGYTVPHNPPTHWADLRELGEPGA